MQNIFPVNKRNINIKTIGNKLKNLTEEEKLKLIRKTIDSNTSISRRHRKRMSHDFLDNIINVYGNEYEESNRDKENDEKMELIYEQRRRANPLKKYIKANRNKYKSNEEFFENNKAYFENNKLKEYSELIKIVNEIEREEREEKEMKEKIMKEKEKKEKDKKLKEIKDKKEKEKKIINANNFSIKSNKEKKLSIDNLEKLSYLSKIPKKFENSKLKQETNLNNINIPKRNKYTLVLKNCMKINDYNFIANKKEYLHNKIKVYTIENNSNEITGVKKLKYIGNELVKESNIININYVRYKVKKENLVENGLSLDELRIKKIKIKKIPNHEKVKKIIKKTEKGNIMKKIINEKNIPLNYMFCINCNECFRNEISNHNEHFLFKIEDFKNEDELDYNERLNIIYNNLKKIQKKIIDNGNKKLIKYYGKLLFCLYEIISNNNSYEELILSIININDNYVNEFKSGTFKGVFIDLFLLFCQKISIITYLKSNELNVNEIIDEKDECDELENDLKYFSSIDEIIKRNKN